MAGDLSPPRPLFFAGERNSYSSTDSGSDFDLPSTTQRRSLTGASRRSKRASVEWNPTALYSDIPQTPNSATPLNGSGSVSSRAPPSSFLFPFQNHPGNPDPGTSIPGQSRRNSVDSLHSPNQTVSQSSHNMYSDSISNEQHVPAVVPAGSIRNLPRVSSTASFRAPFLSPSSRPTSSLWTPPSYPFIHGGPDSPLGSSSALAASLSKSKPPVPSTKIAGKLTKDEKPWVTKKAGKERGAWWITVLCILLGLGGAGVLIWAGTTSVQVLADSDLCQVLDEDWSNGISEDHWERDVSLGGFGNGEFEVCTAESKNSYINNNQLYIMPTLTSDDIGGTDNIFDGYTFEVDGCTTNNKTACSVKSNRNSKTVVNPVKSARITTKGKHTIKYGKVEVRAKLPRGDWLWPAIWMLPQNDDAYGRWPVGGEIDILEARGNGPEYGAQGVNFVRSSLNYGPINSLVTKIYGWWQVKRNGYDEDFHTYTLEWAKDYMRVYVDSRLHAMLDISVKKEKDSFWNRGDYPATAQNGSTEVVVSNPYGYGTWMAPFDQDFYLIINLAAGGTSGWFPDHIGDKPWYDGAATAMYDFAQDQSTWSATWPESADARAFRIDYVKMWKLKDGGSC